MKQKMRPFKDEFSFQERLAESRDILAKYPDRVPVLEECSPGYGKEKVSQVFPQPYSSTSSYIWCRETCLLGNPFTYEVILGKPFLCLSKIPYHQQALVCIVFFMHSPQDRFISGHACFSITDFTATLLDSIYESYKDVDGFLYMSTVAERFLVK
ncbi:autophagy-related protein 8i [Musa acuminata AAA Group]|uniref:autophagy-related protein 8i n=1 Tax=Musa acuminata AAA Group TaxID=214697 RepID=UPI0031D20167